MKAAILSLLLLSCTMEIPENLHENLKKSDCVVAIGQNKLETYIIDEKIGKDVYLALHKIEDKITNEIASYVIVKFTFHSKLTKVQCNKLQWFKDLKKRYGNKKDANDSKE